MPESIQIPLTGGLITNADPADIPLDSCTELVNVDLAAPGRLRKRMAARDANYGMNVNNYLVLPEIYWWMHDGTPYWITPPSNPGVNYWRLRDYRWAGVPVEASHTLDTSSYGDLVKDTARLFLSNGPEADPSVFQYIDREFAWGNGTATYDDWFTDAAPPRMPPITLTALADMYPGSGGKQATETYYYKVAPIFDGADRGLLSTITAVADIGQNDSMVLLDAYIPYNEGNWNPRLTAMEIYRSSTGDPDDYYRIGVIDMLASAVAGVSFDIPVAYYGGIYDGAENLPAGITPGTHVVAPLDAPGTTNSIASVDTTNHIIYFTAAPTFDLWNEPWIIYDSVDWDGSSVYTAGFEADVDSWEGGTGSGWESVIFRTGAHSFDSGYDGAFTFARRDFDGVTLGIEQDAAMTVVLYVYCADACTIQLTAMSTDATGFGRVISTRSGVAAATWTAITLDFTSCNEDGDFSLRLSYFGTDPGSQFYIDDVTITHQVEAYYRSDSGFCGTDVLVSDEIDAGSGIMNGWIGVVTDRDNNTSTQVFVEDTVRRAVKFTSDIFLDTGNDISISLNHDYVWDGLESRCYFKDDYLVDGDAHPLLGLTSISAGYRYGVIGLGRLWGADITLDPNGAAEAHPDWVCYSEVGQYGVIPITNVMQLNDPQGGACKGIRMQSRNIVVLKQHGIYLIDAPADDPSAFSELEADTTIGCVAAGSVTQTKSQVVVFCSEDGVYAILPNFQVVCVSNSIADIYQAQSYKDRSIAAYDSIRGAVLFRFGGVGSTIYQFDIDHWQTTGAERWIQHDLAFDVVALSDDWTRSFLGFEYGPSGSAYMLTLPADGTRIPGNPLYPTTSESAGITRTTGWIPISTLDRPRMVRRLGLRYTSRSVPLAVSLYADGDTDNAIWTGSFTAGQDYMTLRVGRRARLLMVKITTTATNDDVIIDGLEVQID